MNEALETSDSDLLDQRDESLGRFLNYLNEAETSLYEADQISTRLRSRGLPVRNYIPEHKRISQCLNESLKSNVEDIPRCDGRMDNYLPTSPEFFVSRKVPVTISDFYYDSTNFEIPRCPYCGCDWDQPNLYFNVIVCGDCSRLLRLKFGEANEVRGTESAAAKAIKKRKRDDPNAKEESIQSKQRNEKKESEKEANVKPPIIELLKTSPVPEAYKKYLDQNKGNTLPGYPPELFPIMAEWCKNIFGERKSKRVISQKDTYKTQENIVRKRIQSLRRKDKATTIVQGWKRNSQNNINHANEDFNVYREKLEVLVKRCGRHLPGFVEAENCAVGCALPGPSEVYYVGNGGANCNATTSPLKRGFGTDIVIPRASLSLSMEHLVYKPDNCALCIATEPGNLFTLSISGFLEMFAYMEYLYREKFQRVPELDETVFAERIDDIFRRIFIVLLGCFHTSSEEIEEKFVTVSFFELRDAIQKRVELDPSGSEGSASVVLHACFVHWLQRKAFEMPSDKGRNSNLVYYDRKKEGFEPVPNMFYGEHVDEDGQIPECIEENIKKFIIMNLK